MIRLLIKSSSDTKVGPVVITTPHFNEGHQEGNDYRINPIKKDLKIFQDLQFLKISKHSD